MIPGDSKVPHSRPTIVPGSVEAVTSVIESGQHAGGHVRRLFETELCLRVGARHGIAVQSGSAALHLALLALQVSPGAYVVIPTYACMAVLNAVTACGAHPVLADVDPATLNPTSNTIQRAIEREGLAARDVRVIVVPHMIGSPSPIPDIRELGIPIVEDCAMALGAELRDEEVGAWGVVSVFSFYATKMISTGQGGMVITSDEEIAARCRDLIQYDNREAWGGTTWNYPLTDLACALGRAQLPAVDAFLARRRLIASAYDDFARRRSVETVSFQPDAVPNHFRFVLLCDDRDGTQHLLERDGIETKPPVYRSLHRYVGGQPDDFPGAELADRRALSLPIYPSLSDHEVARVIESLGRAL